MDWKEIRANAKEKLKGYCRVCPVCDGRACAGEVPGMGGTGTGSSFQENINALAQYKLNLRTIHNAKNPTTSLKILGLDLKTPVLSAPITGTAINMGGALTDAEYIEAVVHGSIAAGTIAAVGDTGEPGIYATGLEALKKVDGHGIVFIKPRNVDEIISRIRQAEAVGVKALGVDIDGAGLITMALKGQPVGPKSVDELKQVIQSTKLPFIIKGIMTPDEAELAVEVGAAAIVVSNHGGRILDQTPGAADVLPEIAGRIKGKLTIFADGGVRSGIDALKYIALGADAVLVGRPLITAAFGGGTEGVKILLNKLTNELRQAMILTGCASLEQITDRVLF